VTSESPPADQIEEKAMIAYREGRLEEAIDGFAAARQAFLTNANKIKAAEMGGNLCVVLLQADRPQEALNAVEGSPAIFLSVGDKNRAAQAYGNLGSALEACDDSIGAENAYRQATELFDSLGDKEQYGYTMQALSRLQLRRGQPLEAIVSMQLGMEAKPQSGIRNRLLRRLLSLPIRLLNR
jgi:tetratricopeptide (TPR) repeat protein